MSSSRVRPTGLLPDRRASLTAKAVALGRAVGWQELEDPLALRVLGSLEQHAVRVARRVMRLPGGSQVVSAGLAGLNVHAALRMDAIDRQVGAAREAGVDQVVIAGAGYDTRSWRLPTLAGAMVVEVDLPATQSAKRAALADVTPIAEVHLIPADLGADRLDDVLAGSPFDTELPTLWLWEAVVPYLPDAAVRTTAAAMARLSATGSRLAMTFAHPPSGRGVLPAFEAVARSGFRAIGEPLLSAYDDWDMADLIAEAGFNDPVITGSAEWAAAADLVSRPNPLAAERLLVATR